MSDKIIRIVPPSNLQLTHVEFWAISKWVKFWGFMINSNLRYPFHNKWCHSNILESLRNNDYNTILRKVSIDESMMFNTNYSTTFINISLKPNTFNSYDWQQQNIQSPSVSLLKEHCCRLQAVYRRFTVRLQLKTLLPCILLLTPEIEVAYYWDYRK